MLMEAPVFIVMLLLWWNSARYNSIVPLIFFLLFQLHYFQRAFVFPFLLKGKSRMPLAIMMMGMLFNLLNGFMQGEWLFYLAPETLYTLDWLKTPQFILGVLLFFTGMGINWYSDYVIRHLRKPGDTQHYLPSQGCIVMSLLPITLVNYRMGRMGYIDMVAFRAGLPMVDSG